MNRMILLNILVLGLICSGINSQPHSGNKEKKKNANTRTYGGGGGSGSSFASGSLHLSAGGGGGGGGGHHHSVGTRPVGNSGGSNFAHFPNSQGYNQGVGGRPIGNSGGSHFDQFSNSQGSGGRPFSNSAGSHFGQFSNSQGSGGRPFVNSNLGQGHTHGGAFSPGHSHGGGLAPGHTHGNSGGSGSNSHSSGGGATCRRWCKTPQGQAYCCESASEKEEPVGVRAGDCPTVRPQCPPTRIHQGPEKCSNDGACDGYIDKCCFDVCLERHICKPPVWY